MNTCVNLVFCKLIHSDHCSLITSSDLLYVLNRFYTLITYTCIWHTISVSNMYKFILHDYYMYIRLVVHKSFNSLSAFHFSSVTPWLHILYTKVSVVLRKQCDNLCLSVGTKNLEGEKHSGKLWGSPEKLKKHY